MASWRGWVARGSTEAASVTSDRLDASAAPRNRLFPKTRSWFALDAPLELLSPLSVLRVLFAMAVVVWPAVGLTEPLSRWGLIGTAAIAAMTTGVWIGLLMVKKVDLHVSAVLVGYWTGSAGVLVWCAHGGAAVGAFFLYLVPVSAFAALFFARRAVLIQQLGAVVVLWIALSPTQGPARALLIAVTGCVALAVAPATVLILARSARRHDIVDPDTGLPNGFGLARRLEAQNHLSFLVAVVVLDGIADAREALGYQVGTELLRRAVEDLGQVIPSDAVIGRVAGDELVITVSLPGGDAVDPVSPPVPGGLPGGGDRTGPLPVSVLPASVVESGRALADTLVKAIAAGRYRVGVTEVPLRATVGLSGAPWDGTSVSELVRRASISAHRAADEGVSTKHWDGDRGALTVADFELLGDLRSAAERGELTLAYQPQISAITGRPSAVEALLRWESPVRGSISPGRFIPLAERTGLIDRLTEWVVGEALDAQSRWRSKGIELPVSVNLSAKSLPSPELADWILAQVSDRGLPTSCLTVEVTETAVAHPDQALAVLLPLHERGIRISIDDFGTGFTSLAQLPSLPLDELKIDQCFVMRLATSAADDAIVCTIGELASRLGLQVVAEGVETEETAARLRTIGIDLLQGFLFARPMSEAELLLFVAGPGPAPASLPKMIARPLPAAKPRSTV